MTQSTDFLDELATLVVQRPVTVETYSNWQRTTWLNRHAILALGRENEALREAALGLQKDLLDRAEWCPDAGKVVCAGNGAWFRFCQALEGDNQ